MERPSRLWYNGATTKGAKAMAFRIGLIGCGGIAKSAHGAMLARYAALRDGVELTACCDLRREAAEEMARQNGFAQVYDDPERLLCEVRPDAVLLAVPIERTAQVAQQVLAHRIPLLTEKPAGLTTAENDAITAAARVAGVPASVAHNRRHMPLVLALAQELAALRAKGLPPTSIQLDLTRVGRADPDFAMTAIHGIDLVRHLYRQDYEEVFFQYHEHPQSRPAGDIRMLARMTDGALAQLSFCPMGGAVTERVAAHVHDHTFLLELPVWGGSDVPGRLLHMVGDKLVRTLDGTTAADGDTSMGVTNGFFAEEAAFFDALREGRTPGDPVESARQSVEGASCISRRETHYRRANV